MSRPVKAHSASSSVMGGSSLAMQRANSERSRDMSLVSSHRSMLPSREPYAVSRRCAKSTMSMCCCSGTPDVVGGGVVEAAAWASLAVAPSAVAAPGVVVGEASSSAGLASSALDADLATMSIWPASRVPSLPSLLSSLAKYCLVALLRRTRARSAGLSSSSETLRSALATRPFPSRPCETSAFPGVPWVVLTMVSGTFAR
mmetsp:Transcript_75397/g.163107  ORF Transcript_75397/g.163107 Transcript_75397/m.163107 type:complete len:201 (+) Transcript_75397:781-1383(+)